MNKSFNYSGNNLEGDSKTESKTFIKGQWNFQYNFGCISVEGWGNPFLVLCCDSYNEYGQHWGYNYERTGIVLDTIEEGRKLATELNEKYNFPKYFNFSVMVKDLELTCIAA